MRREEGGIGPEDTQIGEKRRGADCVIRSACMCARESGVHLFTRCLFRSAHWYAF